MSKKDELKAVYKEYADTYKKACENSREEYIKHLEPGSTLPKTGILYGDDARNEFSAKCTEFAHKVNEILNEAAEKVNTELLKDPTPEAVNACTLLSLRKSNDRAEYERLLNKYGDNPQTSDTIRSIAKENGVIGLPNNKYQSAAEDIDYLRNKLIFSMGTKMAEQGNTTDARIATMAAVIDEYLPEE